MKKSLFLLSVTVMLAFTACKKTQDVAATPKAVFSTNIVAGSEPKEFDAIQLTNTSTDNNTYLWDFGDGTTSTEKTPTLSYKMHGTYTIKLTVTNSMGQKSTTSHDVLILCRFKNGDHTAAVTL